jgi:tripartite-type tricarboxylate transporter receptor subunit TctC
MATLVCLSGSNTISSSKPNPPFTFAPICAVIQMTRFTFVLYVNPSLPVKTFAELVAYARRDRSTQLWLVGTGSTPHLAFEFLKLHTGMDVVHVPFKGTAQTATAAIAGDIQIGLDAIAAVKPHFDTDACGRWPLCPPGARRCERRGHEEAGVAGVDIGSFRGGRTRKTRGPSSSC